MMLADNVAVQWQTKNGWELITPVHSRKVAIVGSHPKTRELAPYDDPSYEIWLFNEAAQKPEIYRRWDAVLQIHEEKIYTSLTNWVNKDHWAWLQQDHGPGKRIFMQKVDPRVPNSVEYPLEGVLGLVPYKYLRSLVAKEYCACSVEENCVLVLSEFAGASAQLQDGAVLVNPYDTEGMAEALHRAYAMDHGERRARMRQLRRAVRAQDVFWWVNSFLRAAIARDLSNFPLPADYVPQGEATTTRAYQENRLSGYSRDIWGPSKDVLLYIQDSTLKVTANGYAVQLKKADLQQAVSDFTTEVTGLLTSFPLIRFTAR